MSLTNSEPLLPYRLVASLPKPTIATADPYKPIRNKLREFNATSVINLALLRLSNPPKTALGEMQSMPWLTLLLVKWALRDEFVYLRTGPDMTMDVFDSLHQRLWDDPAIRSDDTSVVNGWLLLRTIFYVQYEFQRREGWDFMRWPALYARMQSSEPGVRQFTQAIGVKPQAFMDMVWAMNAAIHFESGPLSRGWWGPLRDAYGADVDKVIGLFTRDAHELRRELRSEDAHRIRGKRELWEFPYLKRFPLFRDRDGNIQVWHRRVFARGIEDAVHLRLAEEFGEEYSQAFSRTFETYVTELAESTGLAVTTEAEYKRVLGGQVHAVEAVIEAHDCNVFVEAKMALFADEVLLQDRPEIMYHKTKRVSEAIRQAWSVAKRIEGGEQYLSHLRGRESYLLVVTSRQLLIGGGENLQNMTSAEHFDYPDGDARRVLPLSNVFILSIEDFERTVGCVTRGEVDLGALVRSAARANEAPDTARMIFSDFLAPYTKEYALPALIENARADSMSRLREALVSE